MECRLLSFDLTPPSETRRLIRQDGVTLVELVVVIAIVGVLVSIASLGLNVWHKSRLGAATAELLADMQTVRMNALTESSNLATRGFGLRFMTDDSYKIFEFVDSGATDFNYEGVSEEVGGYEKTLGAGLTVTLGASGDPTGTTKAVLYDKRGLGRSFNWSTVSGNTYVLRHPNVDRARCITFSAVRIREGVWNDSTSTCTLQ
jgi:prepilin-type N-terminal cleavage/methylation domain-containing protein